MISETSARLSDVGAALRIRNQERLRRIVEREKWFLDTKSEIVDPDAGASVGDKNLGENRPDRRRATGI